MHQLSVHQSISCPSISASAVHPSMHQLSFHRPSAVRPSVHQLSVHQLSVHQCISCLSISLVNNCISCNSKPNSKKLYRKLHCMSLDTSTIRHWDWPKTTRTKWSTAIFSLKTIFSKECLILMCQIKWNFMGSFLGWPSIKKQRSQLINNNKNTMADSLFGFKNISETTCPNLIKFQRKLPCMTSTKRFNKTTTLTTTWTTFWSALENLCSETTSGERYMAIMALLFKV